MRNSGAGILARLSGSILPGIVLHAALDAFALLLSWRLGTDLRVPPLSETGVDVPFILNCVESGLLGGVPAWCYLRLARTTRSELARVPSACCSAAR